MNPQPLRNDLWLSLRDAFTVSPDASPTAALPLVREASARFASPPPSGLRATWLGHSTVLVEIEGAASSPIPSGASVRPVSSVGPRRWYPPPLALSELPPLDAVLISHDHYDHLDRDTILALKHGSASFVVPLGVGAHLGVLGHPAGAHHRARLVAKRNSARRARNRLHAGAARLGAHDCRQGLEALGGLCADRAAQRVYYSGDTGLFPALREIGERLGPFADLPERGERPVSPE